MAEKEYIEREAALALLKDDREVCADSKEELKYIREDIRSIPAADVVERKIGKWITYLEDGFVECPFCHSATNCDGEISELHYCFNCGAQMIGGDEDA